MDYSDIEDRWEVQQRYIVFRYVLGSIRTSTWGSMCGI